METGTLRTIENVRSFNRFYTDILGLLNRHILDSNYSLTEVRILYEIDKTAACTANLLMGRLNVDRGYMSRILKRLEAGGLIRRKASPDDGRKYDLDLTAEGKSLLSGLEEKSDQQVRKLIGHLPEDEQEKLVESMRYIKDTLIEGIDPVKIRTYRKEDLEYIIRRHRELYKTEYGFRSEFGDYVERYIRQFDKSHDEDRENIWIAEVNGAPAGAIALVKIDDGNAQLRWFFAEPEARGRGLGRRLIKTVVDFSKEKNYHHIVLWTVSILDAARHLYRSYGFRLTETKKNDTWGSALTEERWELSI